MVGGFRDFNTIDIGDKRIYPNAWLYDALKKNFEATVKSMWTDSSGHMVTPSKYQKRLHYLVKCYAHIGRHINMGIQDMVEKVLYTQTTDHYVGFVTLTLGETTDDLKKVKPEDRPTDKMIHIVRAHYKEQVFRMC